MIMVLGISKEVHSGAWRVDSVEEGALCHSKAVVPRVPEGEEWPPQPRELPPLHLADAAP